MKIETQLQPNCSEYVLSLTNLKDSSMAKIKELEIELDALRQLSDEEYSKLPKEPDMISAKQWSKEYGTWSELPEVIAYMDRVHSRWDKLIAKYSLKNGENIFDTTIRGFDWSGNNLRIRGYLNEDNFMEWLKTEAEVEDINMGDD